LRTSLRSTSKYYLPAGAGIEPQSSGVSLCDRHLFDTGHRSGATHLPLPAPCSQASGCTQHCTAYERPIPCRRRHSTLADPRHQWPNRTHRSTSPAWRRASLLWTAAVSASITLTARVLNAAGDFEAGGDAATSGTRARPDHGVRSQSSYNASAGSVTARLGSISKAATCVRRPVDGRSSARR